MLQSYAIGLLIIVMLAILSGDEIMHTNKTQ